MRWKQTVEWVGIAIAGLIVLVVVGGLLFPRTRVFKAYAIKKISDATYTSTGARAQIGDLDLSLSNLTAHLHDITLQGTERPDQPALLKINDLIVGIKVNSLFHPQVTLGELLIDHPVVHILSDKKGATNLPKAPPSQSTTHTSVFDLAIGHLQMRNGEINYNDEKTPLEGDLYNLGSDVRFDPNAKSYRGMLSYSEGRLRYANYAPLPHNLSLAFVAAPDRLCAPAHLPVSTSRFRAGIFRAICAAGA